MEKTVLQKLQNWFASRCNGEWEQTYGMAIETIDVPGWRVTIDLEETGLPESSFEPVSRHQAGEPQYVHCHIVSSQFIGVCGPLKLEETIQIFLDWVDANRPEKDFPHLT